MVSKRQAYSQAKTAVFDLQECVNCVRTRVTHRRYLAAASYTDRMQGCINRLRCAIETLSGVSRNNWKVKDHLWGWIEFVVGLASGGILVCIAYFLQGEQLVIGLFGAELLTFLYLNWKEK